MSPNERETAFKGFPDLVAEANGGRILFATDDFFGEAERMLLRAEPEWIETKYTEFGTFYYCFKGI
jgi:allantoicase